MKKIKWAGRIFAAVGLLMVSTAFAEQVRVGPEGDSGGDNHYILDCGELCNAVVAPGTIGAAFTGAWYDPAQSGHGLFIEVLPDNKIQAAWFTFNPAGTEQVWFVGIGSYVGNSATISMTQPTGGRWIPNFDPDQVVNNAWGTLTLTFIDADHGRVDFSSPLGYGTGSMSLTRLTRPSDASISGWISAGNLKTARSGHTATLLQDGKVLIAGGSDASAEVYDPASRTWQETGSMTSARAGGTATLLRDGRVLVAGGNTAELYDPSTGIWTPTGSLSGVHGTGWSRGVPYGHTATLLPNGKVLVAGGTKNFSLVHAVELYDPVTGTWSDAGTPAWSRSEHTATLLQDGTVLFVGGVGAPEDEDLGPKAISSEVYDPVSGSWKSVGARLTVSGHTATLLPDGRLLVVGGRAWDKGWSSLLAGNNEGFYDPATYLWSLYYRIDPDSFRRGHTASLLLDGRVLITGGPVWPDIHSEELFDPVHGTWASASGLNVERAGHTATRLQNGDVLVVGGTDQQGPLNSAELFVSGVRPPGEIGSAFTGSWYDPAQSGHGLFIQVLPNNQFLAAWFAFNPAGTSQAWVMGIGTYNGNTATIAQVIQPEGGRWIPNFDANRIVNNPWGTLKFTFTDCNHGKVEFASALGYGAGSMNLTRLTQPAGLACS